MHFPEAAVTSEHRPHLVHHSDLKESKHQIYTAEPQQLLLRIDFFFFRPTQTTLRLNFKIYKVKQLYHCI